jgi:hypothetical protein
MSEIMRLFASRGLARVAVICASTIVAMQMLVRPGEPPGPADLVSARGVEHVQFPSRQQPPPRPHYHAAIPRVMLGP